jgi:steroid delta-isomerase-like uncharacterized protein
LLGATILAALQSAEFQYDQRRRDPLVTPREIAQRYFDAWNRRDAAAIRATFAEQGTYVDPTSHGPLQGGAIEAYAAGLWAGFSDLWFEVESVAEGPDGLIAAQWIMRGTNTGPFMGLPPSNKRVELRGADFIRVANGNIQSVQGYFDSGELPRQLGLQVVVQPDTIGSVRFGTAVLTSSGKTTKPGAFSVTLLHSRSAEEAAQVVEYSRQITQEMLAMPEFIGTLGVTVGQVMLTLTAWETPEAPRALLRQGTHAIAMREFFARIASGGYTSVWQPERINTMWVRCTECRKMCDSAKPAGKCECGAVLPQAPAYL